MATTKKAAQSKRAEMRALIAEYPGITSAEIAEKLGIPSSNKVGTALYNDIKGGRVLTERVERNGRWMNKHYLPDHLPVDAVIRVKQRIVDASEVIPPPASNSAPTSVFNGPRKPRRGKKRAVRSVGKTATSPQAKVVETQVKVVDKAPSFACAIANDGSLVLMRGGRIELSLSEVDASTLQSYLMKRAAANVFASMV
ncbi:hypothetical protein Q8F57_027035 [Paraburkholderia terrae]|uniref:hypothetical protein n=1 Tax=Paraburkholderia terrae TaxID=311230 RepID=UPI00296B37F7|nr:hypothetical protein [Paraburkholderia terrae]MDW3660273.1 hypothetical protein [Paraburkholderia terrae]